MRDIFAFCTNLLALLMLLFSGVPLAAEASSVIRTGDSIVVSEDQVVEGDYYGLSETSTVSGEVTGDLLYVGGSLTFDGNVTEDVMVLSGAVDIDGTAGDDVRIVGGVVKVGGVIKGDVFVIAESLEILPTAAIEGDLLFFGAELAVNGAVGKNIYGAAETVRINSSVGGDVDMRTSLLTIGERAVITGGVTYISANEITRAQNAQIGGEIVRNDPVVLVAKDSVRAAVVPLLMVVFSALVLYLLFPKLLSNVSLYAAKHSVRSFVVGFAVFFLVPIAVGVLFVSTIGSLLGLVLLFVYFAKIVISILIAGVTATAFVQKIKSPENSVTVSLLSVVAGTVGVFAVLFVPFLGPALFLSFTLVTLGALTIQLYRLLRSS